MNKLIRSLALVALAAFAASPHAQKISADPTATTLTGGEYLAGVQSGANVKVLPSQIQTLTLAAPTTTGKLTTAASTTGGAGFRLPHGAAPTSPVDGDLWTTSAGGLYARVNGSTVGPFGAGGGSGTVTSVGMSVPSFLSVSGSPITTSGTLAVTLSGTALPVVNGGTGTTTPALVAGTNVTITGTWPNQTINSSGGSGTVTSVSMTAPTFLSVSGSPLTTSGTLALTLSGTPLPVANGGTGLTTLTTGNVVLGAGTSTPTFVAPSTSGNVLTSNGSTWISQAAAGGGGSLTNWTEALKTSTPYSTSSAAASFSATNATATDIAAVLAPKGVGAIQGQIADSSTTGGNIRGSRAVDWQTLRATASQVAGGAQAVIGGGVNNSAGGPTNVVGGGTGNATSGTSSAIAGGGSNTASADNAFVGGGGSNVSSNTFTTVAGGNTNTASTRGAAIGGGESNNASGNNSAIPGGKTNTADAIYSFAMGRTAITRGLFAVDAWSPGNTAYASKVQSMRMRLLEQTTSATPKVLTADQSGAGSSTNQYCLNVSMSAGVIGKVVGRTSAGVSSVWTFTAGIKQQTNAAGTALLGTPTVTLVGQDGGASTWGAPTITADTSNGCMAVTVTGVASTTINWIATIDASEDTW